MTVGLWVEEVENPMVKVFSIMGSHTDDDHSLFMVTMSQTVFIFSRMLFNAIVQR